MKRATVLVLIAAAPAFFLGAVWEANRYASLAAEARRIESSEEVWVDENEKLLGSISILSSEARVDGAAKGLGLEKAAPERRVHIVPAPRPSESARAAADATTLEAKGDFGG